MSVFKMTKLEDIKVNVFEHLLIKIDPLGVSIIQNIIKQLTMLQLRELFC